jgi:hypothetical protein
MTIHHQEQQRSLVPFLPSFAASRKDLISEGSRKSLGRRSVVLTLSDLMRSSIGADSLVFFGIGEGNSQQNLDIVELLPKERSFA